MSRMQQRTIHLDARRHARLKVVSEKTRIPMAVLIREGLALVLDANAKTYEERAEQLMAGIARLKSSNRRKK